MNSLLQMTFIYTHFCQVVFIFDYSVVRRRVTSFLSSRMDFINVDLFHYLLISFPGQFWCGFYYRYFSVFKRMVFSVSRGVGLVEHWKQTFAEEEKVTWREGKGEGGREREVETSGKGGWEETVCTRVWVCVHCVCALVCVHGYLCACVHWCVGVLRAQHQRPAEIDAKSDQHEGEAHPLTETKRTRHTHKLNSTTPSTNMIMSGL